jgi:hypothetical protein
LQFVILATLIALAQAGISLEFPVTPEITTEEVPEITTVATSEVDKEDVPEIPKVNVPSIDELTAPALTELTAPTLAEVAAPTFAKVVTPTFAKVVTPTFAKVVAPATVSKITEEDADFDPNPQYTFSYYVSDSVTGDNKAQSESRNGDLVQGAYTLIEPDGTRRTVEYTSDPVNGFNAVVHKDPVGAPVQIAAVPAPGKVATPFAYQQPAVAPQYTSIAKVATPLAYQQPAVAPQYTPIAKVATPLAYQQPAVAPQYTPIDKDATPLAYQG